MHGDGRHLLGNCTGEELAPAAPKAQTLSCTLPDNKTQVSCLLLDQTVQHCARAAGAKAENACTAMLDVGDGKLTNTGRGLTATSDAPAPAPGDDEVGPPAPGSTLIERALLAYLHRAGMGAVADCPITGPPPPDGSVLDAFLNSNVAQYIGPNGRPAYTEVNGVHLGTPGSMPDNLQILAELFPSSGHRAIYAVHPNAPGSHSPVIDPASVPGGDAPNHLTLVLDQRFYVTDGQLARYAELRRSRPEFDPALLGQVIGGLHPGWRRPDGSTIDHATDPDLPTFNALRTLQGLAPHFRLTPERADEFDIVPDLTAALERSDLSTPDGRERFVDDIGAVFQARDRLALARDVVRRHTQTAVENRSPRLAQGPQRALRHPTTANLQHPAPRTPTTQGRPRRRRARDLE